MKAQVTPAFNPPSRFVAHTVGSQVPAGEPTSEQEAQLASCYRACLDAAAAAGCASIAFCCISTGEFRCAALIAVEEVRAWLERVVSNVFGDADERACRALLGEGAAV